MGKPAVPAEKCLRVLKHDVSFSCQALTDPLRQFSDPQKIVCPHAGGGSGESITDNVNSLCSQFYLHPAIPVCRQELPDLADLPRRFDLYLEFFFAKCYDSFYRFFEVCF